ncbi:MAG: glycosyltransferase family 4 protein [Kiritimatiellae bacterium]|nr:glycosyltransferase family 4 protein [Kiritimatiellia bacterium]
MKVCNKVIGMVGRGDPAKGWSDLAVVAQRARLRCLGVGVTEDEAISKFGDSARAIEWEGPQPNGREWIRKMDLFVLTSKHEEMPTVVLECFAEKTPICGFIPEGGMNEILSFSNGPLKEVFIKERDTSRLAEIVISLMNDEARRKAIVEDGWQILVNHFDAEKNCKGQLMDIYRRVVK